MNAVFVLSSTLGSLDISESTAAMAGHPEPLLEGIPRTSVLQSGGYLKCTNLRR